MIIIMEMLDNKLLSKMIDIYILLFYIYFTYG